MLYILMEPSDEGYSGVTGVYEGPDGLDIDGLAEAFFSQFDWRGLGKHNYPEYAGPKQPLHYGPCSSGSLPEGTMVMDISSPEYVQWDAERKKMNQEWARRRESRIREVAQMYPGKDLQEMFLSYLSIAVGLRKRDDVKVS